MSRVRRASFVVRVVENQVGQVSGIVEQVATGAKEPFTDLEGIGRVIGTMLHGAPASLPEPSRGGPVGSEASGR